MKSLAKPLQHFSPARVAGTCDTEIVRPGSHYMVVWVIAVVQTDPKDKGSEFDV